jgi:hypothetical protein
MTEPNTADMNKWLVQLDFPYNDTTFAIMLKSNN